MGKGGVLWAQLFTSNSAMQTCKMDVDGDDVPGNWKCDDSHIEKRSGVQTIKWKLVPQFRGVWQCILQPDHLVYWFVKGNSRVVGSFQHFTCKCPYILGGKYTLEIAAKYVLWQKNQAIMAVEKESLANEKRNKTSPTFFRRDPQANQSLTIPGHLNGKLAGDFICDLTSICTVKRFNEKKWFSPGLNPSEATWLVHRDPSGGVRAGREQIIRYVLGRRTR